MLASSTCVVGGELDQRPFKSSLVRFIEFPLLTELFAFDGFIFL